MVHAEVAECVVDLVIDVFRALTASSDDVDPVANVFALVLGSSEHVADQSKRQWRRQVTDNIDLVAFEHVGH